MKVIADAKTRPRLLRALTLADLILYGVLVISPVGAMFIFGLLSERGHGHVVTAVLIAMVAMMFTSISYGRMARAYPSAGSAYTYVTQDIHPGLGYITGWGMAMDYTLGPMLAIIWCAEQSHNFGPGVSVSAWKIFYAAVLTFLNIQAIRSSARITAGIMAAMGAVVVVLFIAAAYYLFAHPPSNQAFFARPFYDPKTFSYSGLFGATSLAVLTYLGLDAISTMSEETENPHRNIPLATVLACLVIGILAAAEVYVGQLIWPAAEKFPDVDTAYVWVAGRAWQPLFTVVGLMLILGFFAGGMGAQLAVARLLYGMGRSGALPQRFFGAIDRKHHIPRNNILFIGIIVLIGTFLLSFSLAAEMVNFGALIAFMGVNAAAFLRYYVRAPQKKVWNFIPPVLGFFICLALWLNLSHPAKLWGSVWMAVGITFGAWKTRGFRTPLSFEVPKE